MEIKYHNLYYSYYENTAFETIALEDINLKIEKEKITGIVGEKGSGKTTFANVTNLLLLPTMGEIEIGKKKIEAKKKRKDLETIRMDMGFVFENPKQQFLFSTVLEEIAFGLELNSHSKMEKKIKDSLTMVGLDDSYLNKNPLKLSFGEKRKVAIASILALNPSILIFDEPTIGLDGISKESFIKMLKILKNRYHKTIIVLSHDVNFIHRIADEVIVLHHGKKVLAGTKYEVFGNEQIENYGISCSSIIEFSKKVLEKKGIKLGYRDDINDLIKDIYRHVS